MISPQIGPGAFTLPTTAHPAANVCQIYGISVMPTSYVIPYVKPLCKFIMSTYYVMWLC
jgi:hypothetical protein